ncbi:MAG: hypothetical protein AABY22_01260 [Nanoarchaeota archaeon]
MYLILFLLSQCLVYWGSIFFFSRFKNGKYYKFCIVDRFSNKKTHVLAEDSLTQEDIKRMGFNLASTNKFYIPISIVALFYPVLVMILPFFLVFWLISKIGLFLAKK